MIRQHGLSRTAISTRPPTAGGVGSSGIFHDRVKLTVPFDIDIDIDIDIDLTEIDRM